jgi:hypothetical protein
MRTIGRRESAGWRYIFVSRFANMGGRERPPFILPFPVPARRPPAVTLNPPFSARS